MKNLLLLLITINCQASYSYQTSIARYEPTSPSKDYPSNFSPAFSPSFTGHDTHSHSAFPTIHLISNSSCSYPNKYLPDLADFKSGPSSLRLKLRSSYGDDREYFYDKFGNLKNAEIFHKFKCYQYPGFLKLVKSIPEFEEFILHLEKTRELIDGSPLYKTIHSNLDPPTASKIWDQLISMPNSVRNWQKIREFNFRNEQLHQAGFDVMGINLARSRGIDHEFIYSCDNVQQVQRSLIIDHLNELAVFANQENHITYPLRNITQKSETFAIAANNANRNNKQEQSGALIEVAKGFLSLAKGFADTCGRTGIAIADAIEHPINTLYEVNDAVCQISHSIAKVANTWGKFQAATDLMDLEMLNEANGEIEYACSCGRQVYEMVKHKYNTSSRAEILEMTGSLIANAVIAGYAIPQMQAAAIQEIGATIKLGKTAILSSCNLNKLGSVGKKIKQSTGLLCKKGTDYFAKSANFTEELEFVLASEIGNIKIPAGNLLKQEAQITPSSKQIIDVARTATKVKTYKQVPLSQEIKTAIKTTKHELAAYERLLRQQGKTYKDIFGTQIPDNLKNKLIQFKGFTHIRTPEIKQTVSKAGKVKTKITGLHWDFNRRLEKLGMYKLKNIETLPGNMYKADLHFGGIIKEGKTFFPDSWDHKKLFSKINEACNNILKIKQQRDGTTIIIGIVSEGFEITTKLNNGRIITIYPHLNKKLI